MNEKELLKTGTTTLGLVCKDGIVLAADKRATSGHFIVNKRVEKIHLIADTMAVTMAGTVSDAQLLTKLIKAEIKLKEIRNSRQMTVKEAANLLAGMVYGNIRRMSMIPGIAHFVMGGSDNDGFHIYDLFADGSITEVDDFISSGSGSVMAYGVLETLYQPNLTVDEGVKLAVKSINAALQRDSASGGGIDVITFTKEGFKRVLNKEFTTKVEI